MKLQNDQTNKDSRQLSIVGKVFGYATLGKRGEYIYSFEGVKIF